MIWSLIVICAAVFPWDIHKTIAQRTNHYTTHDNELNERIENNLIHISLKKLSDIKFCGDWIYRIENVDIALFKLNLSLPSCLAIYMELLHLQLAKHQLSDEVIIHSIIYLNMSYISVDLYSYYQQRTLDPNFIQMILNLQMSDFLKEIIVNNLYYINLAWFGVYFMYLETNKFKYGVLEVDDTQIHFIRFILIHYYKGFEILIPVHDPLEIKTILNDIRVKEAIKVLKDAQSLKLTLNK